MFYSKLKSDEQMKFCIRSSNINSLFNSNRIRMRQSKRNYAKEYQVKMSFDLLSSFGLTNLNNLHGLSTRSIVLF